MPRNSQPSRRCVFLLALLALLSLSACLPDADQPLPLRLAYAPSDQTLGQRNQSYEALRRYLERQIGRPVELVQTNAYQPALAALREGDIDLISLGSQAYLIAEAEGLAEAFALRGKTDGSPHVYHSVLIAPAASPYPTIEQALQHANRLRVLYTNPASTSGYLVARSFYQEIGIDPIAAFAEASFSHSHALSILKVSNRQADLANVSSRILQLMIERGKVDPATLLVLWRSAPIPNGPIAYRSNLPDDLKQSIRQAFFQLPELDPNAWTLVQALYPNETFVYIPYLPEAHDTLRSLRASLHIDDALATD